MPARKPKNKSTKVARKPKLRIIKVASTQTAIPGETVDFTLRVDNIGTQVVGNAVILDSLTTRLEYVPDSAQSSRDRPPADVSPDTPALTTV